MAANFNFTKIVNFKKLHYPLAYNPVIDREISVGESDLRLTGFFFGFHTSKGKNGTFIGSFCWLSVCSFVKNTNLEIAWRSIKRYELLCLDFAAFSMKFTVKSKPKGKALLKFGTK